MIPSTVCIAKVPIDLCSHYQRSDLHGSTTDEVHLPSTEQALDHELQQYMAPPITETLDLTPHDYYPFSEAKRELKLLAERLLMILQTLIQTLPTSD